MEKLDLMKNHSKTIADYLAQNTTPMNRLDVVKNLLTFDGILIGFKLVEATLKADHKEKVIAFAGGTHIGEAYELLQKVGGYEPIGHAEASAIKASVARGINANLVDGSLNAKPHPISLELLDHYLKK
jgi:hypothetical protein